MRTRCSSSNGRLVVRVQSDQTDALSIDVVDDLQVIIIIFQNSLFITSRAREMIRFFISRLLSSTELAR